MVNKHAQKLSNLNWLKNRNNPEYLKKLKASALKGNETRVRQRIEHYIKYLEERGYKVSKIC